MSYSAQPKKIPENNHNQKIIQKLSEIEDENNDINSKSLKIKIIPIHIKNNEEKKDANIIEINNEINMEKNEKVKNFEIKETEEKIKDKIKILKNFSNDKLHEGIKEFYLISRDIMVKINNYLSADSDIKFSDLKNPKNNDVFLLDKEIIDKAISLNPEDKNKMIILKPKYAFCNKFKPVPVNKDYWDCLNKYFEIKPEIKEYSEIVDDKGVISYKRDYCKYIRINCIILPKKRKYNNNITSYKNLYSNMSSYGLSSSINPEEIINDIQNFYFFIHKKTSINDVIIHIEQIINKYQYINLDENKDYKCWIDINYYDFEQLLMLIKEKISQIYNIYNINPSLPIDLQKLEDEDSKNEIMGSNLFNLKLFPLKIFENEKLINIFPNQFTDNFSSINSCQVYAKNRELKYLPDQNIEQYEFFKKFPELTIIIEQNKDSIFYKDESKLKYQIKKCSYYFCNNKGILPIYCECLQKYYCSLKCKNSDKKYHEDECQYSLSKYFLDVSYPLMKPITKESSLGLTGIRNIGNTCYMNTALQCISNCIELRNYFLFGSPKKDINTNNVLGYKGLVAYGFEYLIRKLWIANDKVIDISKFKTAIGLCNERFAGRSQQDTHEFVTFLIDSLHEDLNRVENKSYIAKEERDLNDEIKSKIEWNNYLKRNQSILVDLFYGLFKSTVVCSVCDKSCIDFNVFSSISLNLGNDNQKQKEEKKSNIDNKLNLDKKQDNSNDNNINNNFVIDLGDDDNNESDKENKNIKNNEIPNKNLDLKINNKISISNGNDDIKIIESPKINKEILVGGKSHDNNSNTNYSEKKVDNIYNDVELNYKIPLIFFFYSLDEIPIQFILPIKTGNELTHKILLYKISHLLNKDPYSLCLYHISSSDKNIIHIYGKNNFNTYNKEKLDNKVLFISEIGHDTIKNNLNKESNAIFYDARCINFRSNIENISKENLEQNLIKNKEDIKKCLNNIINEDDIKDYKDKFLYTYYMDLSKVFQFTLKNYVIINKNNSISKESISFPRIFFFSKNKTLLDLYYEIFKIYKKIILFDQFNKQKELKDNFEKIFFGSLNKELNNEIKDNNNNVETPFYLGFKIYDKIENKYNNEIIANLTEKEIDKKIENIIKEIIDINEDNNNNNKQIILEVYWNRQYKEKLVKILKPEKIDLLIEKIRKEEKPNLNPNLNSIDYFRQKQKEFYDNFYEKNKIVAPLILSNSDIKNIENNLKDNIEEEKNENLETKTKLKKPLFTPVFQSKKEEKKEISLIETFELLREEEFLDENNEWYCENCKKKQRAKKKLEIYNAPKILILQLKRFNHMSKINTKVNYPLTDLDLSKYIISNNTTKKSIKYDLFAVANHYGTLSFGHYTAFCKNSITGKWYEFNDSIVSEINDLSSIITSNAYVLFYRQKELSKLNWHEIFRKNFIEIDINNPQTMVDFNYDFVNYCCNYRKIESDKDDVNEFDKKIKDIVTKNNTIKKNESNENKNYNEMNIEDENKIKKNDFLNKKRSSSDDN